MGVTQMVLMQNRMVLVLMASAISLAPLGAQAESGTLLKDRQMVNIDFTSGPASKAPGSRGMGKFRQGLDEAKGTFGPAKVLKHTATELRFKGKKDDCTLKANRTVTCKSGSKGTWQ
jgi:hypothetical protein